jgi:anaerobic magnesium-protoporphyrin IX monomethyl ester cyclase
MKIALIYPPTADPTAPYLSVPALTGYLRSNGVEVLPVDANIEAYCRLLRGKPLGELVERIERRLARLQRKSSLDHTSQLAYCALRRAQETARSVPAAIEEAIAVMRDRSGHRFFDPTQYEAAVTTVEQALRVISAAYTPLNLDFTGYRTPFALLNMAEIEADARPDRNPFYAYFDEALSERLAHEAVDLAGISVAFPGQLQPAYTLAYILKRRFPDMHLTVGGPAITQILVRLKGDELARALGPFHSAVLFEGEQALLDLIQSIERDSPVLGVIRGKHRADLADLPSPDFAGLPLDQYLSPEPVLPYDPTRGCYWGRCAFCHYGLTECGTARYRERPVERVLEHLQSLADTHDCRLFYFSQDTIAPATARRLARAHAAAGLSWRWGTDMRPEPALTVDCCTDLAEGGALSAALGIESGSDRVLGLINKGVDVKEIRAAVEHLAGAGIAVEFMCFIGFPTESFQEAMATIRLIETLHDDIALFVCGEFALVPGALLAQRPADYGIAEIWKAEGDEFTKALFYREKRLSKQVREQDKINAAIDALSMRFWLHKYPWAGSLSTAHTLLWYAHFGPDAFRRASAGRPTSKGRRAPRPRSPYGFDVAKIGPEAEANEANVWYTLTHQRRLVSRNAYRELANRLPSVTKRYRESGRKRRIAHSGSPAET